jgi:tyrosinase-like protein
MTTTQNKSLNQRSLLTTAQIILCGLAVSGLAASITFAQTPTDTPQNAAGTPQTATGTPQNAAAVVYVRKNASSPAAKADLDALNLAIGKMKKLGCADPTSWYYQGGIHWVPDDKADGSTLGKGNALCSSYNGTTAALKAAWDNCTHQQGMELHFLIWHRLYIYYLEDIVRAKSGKADFALPYWNYVDQKDALMPAVFADKKSNLYEPARCTVLNQKKPIESKEYGPGKDLDITLLMKKTHYSAFNSTIDTAPHGAMHNYIGGGTDEETFLNRIYQATLPDQGGVMSQVPSAAFDPIFWVHHAEIDYLWQQWINSPKGQKPNLAQLKAAPIPYNFFDRNGKPVTLTVDQAYTMAFSLPVTYDTMKVASLAEAKLLMSEKVEETVTEPMEIAHSATPQVVKGKETTLSMKMEMKAGLNDLVAPESNHRLILHLLVSFAKEPKGSYHVYLVNDADKQSPSAPTFIGHMTFFGAAHHARHAAAKTEPGHDHKMTKNFEFNVSEQIDPKTFNGNLHLVVKKDGDPKEQDELIVEEQSLKMQ